MEKVQNSPAITSLLSQHADTLNYIKNKTGKNIDNLEKVFRLYQLFSSEDSLGLTLPDWAPRVFPYFVLNLTLQRYILENSNNDLIKFSGGQYQEYHKFVKTMTYKLLTLMKLINYLLVSSSLYGLFYVFTPLHSHLHENIDNEIFFQVGC